MARDQGVSSAPVLDTIELAIGATDDAVTPAAPSPAEPPPPPPTTGGDAPTPTTSTSTSTTTTTTAPPPPPAPDGGLLAPVLEPVSDVLVNLLDLIGLGAD